MSEYYTYLLIDPRTGLPFYVGKGKGRRCYSHVADARNTTKNSQKLNKIRKIESLGLEVTVKKVEEGVTDAESQDLERLIIAECKDLGIKLTNQTIGGDGSSGYKHRPDSLEKIALSQRGVKKPESQRKKLSAYLLKNPIYALPGVKEKRSGENHWAYGKEAKNKGMRWTDEQRAALSAKFTGEGHPNYGKPCSPERKAAISAATKGVKKSTTVNMRKPKQKIQCPHCGKMASGGNIARWHGDNCKGKNNVSA